jgi:hypothetical protein
MMAKHFIYFLLNSGASRVFKAPLVFEKERYRGKEKKRKGEFTYLLRDTSFSFGLVLPSFS